MELSQARAVAVLTRAPSRGGKTRLFEALGSGPDSTLLAAMLLDTLDAVRRVDARLIVAVEPAAACAAVQKLVGAGVTVVPQPAGDLGVRMARTMRSLLDDGATAVVLVGSDLPELTAQHVTLAFDALARDPAAVVLGPTLDGGYYLIAFSAPAAVFDSIAWGTSEALAQTVRAVERCSRPVVLLEPMGDVDTPDDLRRVARSRPGSRTAAWARRLGAAS